MASQHKVALAALLLCVLASCASATACPTVRGVFYRNLDASYWASRPGQALCRRVISSPTSCPASSGYLTLCGTASACNCAGVPAGSATPCQVSIQQVNALVLDTCASTAGRATRNLPILLNIELLTAASTDCAGALGSSGLTGRVALTDIALTLASRCTIPGQCSSGACGRAGSCAAFITSSLQCTSRCADDIGCEVRGNLRGTITPFSNATTSASTGWVSRTLNTFGEFFLTTTAATAPADRLQVSIPVPPASGLINLHLINAAPAPGGTIPALATDFGGAVGGSSQIALGDIQPTSPLRSYAFLAAVQERAPGPAEPGVTSATFTLENRIESSIWTFRSRSNMLTPRWVNHEDPLRVTPTLFQGVEAPVSFLALIGNLNAFCLPPSPFASDCTAPGSGVVTLEFVPA